jgi:hypothetical protein
MKIHPILKQISTHLKNGEADTQPIFRQIKNYLEIIAQGELENID